MDTQKKSALMPTKTYYKLLVAFCLMSVYPLLTGIYIASCFIKFPFHVEPSLMFSISAAIFFSLVSSLIGLVIVKQLTNPIISAQKVARDIATGRLETNIQFQGSDEIEDLSKSLKTISQNAYELMQKVEKLSVTDKLTGLYSAQYIHERLSEEVQRSLESKIPCAIAHLKLDHFPAYAANSGVAVSEEALKALAKIFVDNTTKFDRVGRVGVDEFLVVFANKSSKESFVSVDHMRRQAQAFFSQHFQMGAFPLSFCAGLSEAPADGKTAEALMDKAKEKLYAAKQRGTGQLEPVS